MTYTAVKSIGCAIAGSGSLGLILVKCVAEQPEGLESMDLSASPDRPRSSTELTSVLDELRVLNDVERSWYRGHLNGRRSSTSVLIAV